MGNRAVITTFNGKEEEYRSCMELGIYLHWNGGWDSVRAFLMYCRMKGYVSPEKDGYGWARLAQVIANWFDDGLSAGLDNVCKLDYDNYDNGVYVIKNWEIVDRKFMEGSEQTGYDLLKMLLTINEKQPEGCQMTDEEIVNKLGEIFPDGYEHVKPGETAKTYYGVQQTYNDKGAVTAAYIVTRDAYGKPKNTRTYGEKSDKYVDWFDTRQEAREFIKGAMED